MTNKKKDVAMVRLYQIHDIASGSALDDHAKGRLRTMFGDTLMEYEDAVWAAAKRDGSSIPCPKCATRTDDGVCDGCLAKRKATP